MDHYRQPCITQRKVFSLRKFTLGNFAAPAFADYGNNDNSGDNSGNNDNSGDNNQQQQSGYN
jgi:hypothetical protein